MWKIIKNKPTFVFLKFWNQQNCVTQSETIFYKNKLTNTPRSIKKIFIDDLTYKEKIYKN